MGTTSSAPSGRYRRMVWWCTWRMPANSVSPWMPSRRCMPRRSSSTVASWTAAFGERSATHTTRRCPGCSRRGEEPGIGGLMAKLDLYDTLARQLRADSIRCSTAAGSGHPTSSLSAADLMAVLLAGHLRYDFAHPDDPANDHLIFSKGHASPLVYAVFKAAGAISDDELMTFRKFGSKLEGHPTPVLPWVDVATGSLGQGLPIGVGIALAGKRVLDAPYHVWILVGDSESAEGSIWEAFDHAGHEGLANLTAIIDVNRLGQRGPTELEWDMGAYAARVRAFGVDPIVIDGHDAAEIDDAYARARGAARPTAILARTVKGKGVSFLENKEGWHGKALDPEQAKQALAELGEARSRTFPVMKPERWERPSMQRTGSPALKSYTEPIATRKAYGEALAAL